ncbi:MAG TPA: hypothetical protein VMF07_22055 [Solirubrobacteraceae bacterium]|nr:hypothetical protein [Solirubrobacteraceae bacterium]
MSEELGRYLRDGPAQRHLLAVMADGHARLKHGRELGSPDPAVYRARVRAHLANAPLATVAFDAKGQRTYLLADPARNQVAWIAPHKESRSTFFQPRQGAAAYVRQKRSFASSLPLDLDTVRAAALRQTRTISHSITSVQRGRGGPDRGR